MLARLWRVAWVGGKRETNEEAKLENEENKLGKHVQLLLLTLSSLLDASTGVEESLAKL
jgi:hypothetical protein